MSDFDYDPTAVSRVMSRVRSDLHGPDHGPTAGTAVSEGGRTMRDAIAQVPVFNPPLAIDLQGKTLFLGDQTGVTPKSAVATSAPSAATAKPLHEGAVRAEIGRVSAQLGDPHLPQSDASRPPLRELFDLLQGVDAILRAGMQPAPETVARIEELRASTPVRSLSDYKDPELRAALASTRLERDRAVSSGPGNAVLLQQRLTALEREGERRWGDSEPCLDARPTLVPASQLPRGSYSPEELLSCTGPAGACASVDQVARIEAKRQEECAWTGVDPLHFADMAHGVPTADVENGAAKAERNTQKWLEIIASETQNPLAAAVAASSLARGEGVNATLARVQLADAIGGVAASLAATGQRAQAFDTTEPLRTERAPSPLEPPALARGAAGPVPRPPSSVAVDATIGAAVTPAVSAVASSSVGVATSYRPREMLSQYVGENLPGNAVWRGRGAGQVTYLSATERQKLALDIRDGVIFDASGQRFDTATSNAIEGGRGRAIFVMDMQGTLYASNFQRMGEFHHSSFVAGGPVLAAGELVVDNGRLILVSDSSGHYQPAQEHMDQLMRVLEQKGVRVDMVERETSATRAPRPR